MDNQYNRGVVIAPQKPSDWIMGQETGITEKTYIQDGNWRPYLPTPDKQFNAPGVYDALDCVTQGALHLIEAKMNFLIKTGALPQNVQQAIQDLGFIDSNGSFKASKRFTAKMSGTTKQGNSVGNVWDSIRHDGILPAADYSDNAPTFDEFYQAIPQPLIDKAQQILQYFDFQYDWISYSNYNAADAAALKSALQISPVQILTAVCPPFFGTQQDATPLVPACGLNVVHSTMLFAYEDGTAWDDFDSYADNYFWDNFTHRLAWNYIIPYAVRGDVILKQLPVVPVKPTYQFNNILSFGYRSQDVVNLQNALKYDGEFPATIPSTGYYGSITASAVEKFQLKYRLIPSASYWQSINMIPQVGPKTLKKLNELFSN